MRWSALKKVDENGFEKWFAWYPVVVDSQRVWLEHVGRKGNLVDRRIFFVYKDLNGAVEVDKTPLFNENNIIIRAAKRDQKNAALQVVLQEIDRLTQRPLPGSTLTVKVLKEIYQKIFASVA